MKRFFIPALCALTLSLAAPAMARPFDAPGRMKHGPVEMRMERLMDQLKLSPEQRGQLETLRARQQESAKALMQTSKGKQGELMDILKASHANKDQALAKQREINAVHDQLSEMRIHAWFEARKILTPEQLKQLENQPKRKTWRR